MIELLKAHPELEVEVQPGPWPDGARTNYEAKFVREGRPIRRLRARYTPADTGPALHPQGALGIVAAHSAKSSGRFRRRVHTMSSSPLRRLGRVVLIVLGLLVLGLGIAYFLADRPRPEGQEGPEADAMAKRMMAAIDDLAWQRRALCNGTSGVVSSICGIVSVTGPGALRRCGSTA